MYYYLYDVLLTSMQIVFESVLGASVIIIFRGSYTCTAYSQITYNK